MKAKRGKLTTLKFVVCSLKPDRMTAKQVPAGTGRPCVDVGRFGLEFGARR